MFLLYIITLIVFLICSFYIAKPISKRKKQTYNHKDCPCDKNKPFLQNLLEHVDKYFDDSSFDDEKEAKIIFEKIIKHLTPKKTAILTKKEIYEQYSAACQIDRIPVRHEIFELLIRQDSNKSNNGENCISYPSVALNSCPQFCSFCPTGKGIAKSYTIGQAVFRHFIENEESHIRYLLQHLLNQYFNGNSIEKIAVRHLGGTFTSYSELYRLRYTCDMYYCTNVIFDVIKYDEAKPMLLGKFDPNNTVISKLRPIHLSDEIIEIEREIELLKCWGKPVDDVEEKLIKVLHKTLLFEQNQNTYISNCKVVS